MAIRSNVPPGARLTARKLAIVAIFAVSITIIGMFSFENSEKRRRLNTVMADMVERALDLPMRLKTDAFTTATENPKKKLERYLKKMREANGICGTNPQLGLDRALIVVQTQFNLAHLMENCHETETVAGFMLVEDDPRAAAGEKKVIKGRHYETLMIIRGQLDEYQHINKWWYRHINKCIQLEDKVRARIQDFLDREAKKTQTVQDFEQLIRLASIPTYGCLMKLPSSITGDIPDHIYRVLIEMFMKRRGLVCDFTKADVARMEDIKQVASNYYKELPRFENELEQEDLNVLLDGRIVHNRIGIEANKKTSEGKAPKDETGETNTNMGMIDFLTQSKSGDLSKYTTNMDGLRILLHIWLQDESTEQRFKTQYKDKGGRCATQPLLTEHDRAYLYVKSWKEVCGDHKLGIPGFEGMKRAKACFEVDAWWYMRSTDTPDPKPKVDEDGNQI